MSIQSATSWFHEVFQQLGVMALAVVLATLTFAVAEAHPAQNPGTPVWSALAASTNGAIDRAA